jgi:hypothetical protein
MVVHIGDSSRLLACGFVDQSVLLRLAAPSPVFANSRGFSQAIVEIAKNWLRFAGLQLLIVAYFIFPKKLSTA